MTASLRNMKHSSKAKGVTALLLGMVAIVVVVKNEMSAVRTIASEFMLTVITE